MASRKIWYDSQDPQMLSASEIASMSPQECQAACDQIDQNLVGVLQEIDHQFSLANQVVIQRLLPTVQRYGENSQKIWESVKIWKTFFETAANIRLNEPYAGEDSLDADQTIQEHSEEPTIQPNDSDNDDSNSSRGILFPDSTPKGNYLQHNMNDPFIIPQSIDKLEFPHPSEDSFLQSTKNLPKTHDSLDLSFDETDVKFPSFETMPRLDLFKQEESLLPPSRLRPGAEKHNSDLLHKVLQKNISSPRKAASPVKGYKAALPKEYQKDWNGVTDMSKTNLSAFQWGSPEKPSFFAESPLKIGSSYIVKKTISQTPAKEAARRVAKDLYQADLSEMSPPSAIKTWTRRFTADSEKESIFNDNGDIFDDSAVDENLMEIVESATARINDLLANEANDYPGVIDDDDYLPQDLHDYRFREEESFEEEPSEIYEPDGPEDTLFGMPTTITSSAPEETLFGIPNSRADDSFDTQSEFKVMGPNDMATLHGGILLESEPFVASPLAGKGR